MCPIRRKRGRSRIKAYAINYFNATAYVCVLPDTITQIQIQRGRCAWAVTLSHNGQALNGNASARLPFRKCSVLYDIVTNF